MKAPFRFHSACVPSRRVQGLTLIELMTVLTVLGVLLGIGVPSFQDLIRDNRLKAHTDAFLSSLSRARAEAVARNVSVTVCSSSDGTTCSGSWSDGWIVFIDCNANGAVNNNTCDLGVDLDGDGTVSATEPEMVIQVVNNVPTGVVVETIANNANIRFNSRGYRADGGGALVARFDDARDNRCRIVDINLVGRASTRTDSSGRPVCA